MKFFQPAQAESGHRDLASLIGPDVQVRALNSRSDIALRFDALRGAEPKYRAERFRLVRGRVVTDYLSAIEQVRELAGREDLLRLRAMLTRRLEHGLTLDPNPKRDALWGRLLAEYEVVEDALAENAIWRWLDRLNDLEAALGSR